MTSVAYRATPSGSSLRSAPSSNSRVRSALSDGRAAHVAVYRSSGSPSLDNAAVDAVYGWTFEPARKNGAPVPGRVVVPVRFSMTDR